MSSISRFEGWSLAFTCWVFIIMLSFDFFSKSMLLQFFCLTLSCQTRPNQNSINSDLKLSISNIKIITERLGKMSSIRVSAKRSFGTDFVRVLILKKNKKVKDIHLYSSDQIIHLLPAGELEFRFFPCRWINNEKTSYKCGFFISKKFHKIKDKDQILGHFIEKKNELIEKKKQKASEFYDIASEISKGKEYPNGEVKGLKIIEESADIIVEKGRDKMTQLIAETNIAKAIVDSHGYDNNRLERNSKREGDENSQPSESGSTGFKNDKFEVGGILLLVMAARYLYKMSDARMEGLKKSKQERVDNLNSEFAYLKILEDMEKQTETDKYGEKITNKIKGDNNFIENKIAETRGNIGDIIADYDSKVEVEKIDQARKKRTVFRYSLLAGLLGSAYYVGLDVDTIEKIVETIEVDVTSIFLADHRDSSMKNTIKTKLDRIFQEMIVLDHKYERNNLAITKHVMMLTQ